jgi:hypothetical protein
MHYSMGGDGIVLVKADLLGVGILFDYFEVIGAEYHLRVTIVQNTVDEFDGCSVSVLSEK